MQALRVVAADRLRRFGARSRHHGRGCSGVLLGRRSGARLRRGPVGFVALLAASCCPLAFAPTPLRRRTPTRPVFDGKEIKDLCTISSRGTVPGLPAAASACSTPAPCGRRSRGRRRRCARSRTRRSRGPWPTTNCRPATATRSTSWGRDRRRRRELWAWSSRRIGTPEPAIARSTSRTSSTWMAGLASAQANEAALQAGAEYTTWAGLDANRVLEPSRGPATTAATLTTSSRPTSGPSARTQPPARWLLPLPAAGSLRAPTTTGP